MFVPLYVYHETNMLKLPCVAVLAASALLGAHFENAVVVLPASATTPQKKAAQMLVEEIEKRTQLRLKLSSNAATGAPAIYLRLGTGKPESFTLTSTDNQIVVAGADDRGVVFGTGYLLRQFHMSRQKLELDANLKISSAPKYAVRGQQLGYRPKTNAYDAWSVPMWEQYIRELAIFGNNTIELIPPRSDDNDDSPHFPLPKIEMMEEMSRIANEYGLDVSVWFPAMDKDYSDPAQVEFALKEWAEVFRRLPRIDAIFVPGGDPGHTQPKYLFALLEKQRQELRKYHPKGQMWMSPQNFDAAWFQEFLDLMRNEPKWLDGVVYGPWTRVTIQELRAKIPAHYPIRYYPDITHTIHAEFPVPEWDVAFAVTQARESINPRPTDYKKIFHHMMPASMGFLTYSEGVNDDMNKFVWSGLGWNPDQDVSQILREWARWFISPKYETALAQAVLDLEQDWHGPLLPRT